MSRLAILCGGRIESRVRRPAQGPRPEARRTEAVLAAIKHRVVLCADDFGLTEGVSRGILELAHSGRLSATSAMTTRPWWPKMAPQLAALEGKVSVGLHLTLTLGRPLGPMPRFTRDGAFPRHGDLLARALSGRLPLDETSSEIERQLQAFEAALGRGPDFVDGHQHVHVLPGIRAALFEALKHGGRRVWLRDPTDRLSAILKRGAPGKAAVVAALAAGFRSAARRAGFDTNEGFSGFSGFDPSIPADALFERSFAELGPCPLVMCHPGHVDAELKGLDPVVEARAREQAYLASERFLRLLEERRIELVTSPA